MQNLVKKLGVRPCNLPVLTEGEKLSHLQMSNADISRINNIAFETVWYETDDSHEGTEITINLVDIEGINKEQNFRSWFDSFKTLKKQDHFTNFPGNTKFEDILTNPNNRAELPRVIKVDNKYYVSGNGRHRLTIAKCLGLTTQGIKVVLVQTKA